MEVGPIWDTYDFLSNAMYFAGQGFGYTDLTRPPFLPFLTSLLFRLGFVYESTIYYLDAFFLVFGAVGLYLFFRMKFEPIISFFGSLLFSTFPVVIIFAGIGLSDIPSVALSIWALYTTVLAVKRDSKFFYLSFSLGVLAFLTRYPAGFIVFPMLFYLIINRKSLSIKPMIGGILFFCLRSWLFYFFRGILATHSILFRLLQHNAKVLGNHIYILSSRPSILPEKYFILYGTRWDNNFVSFSFKFSIVFNNSF
jgi:4-amino-4-deoxy-L-arabinose transferase-like glycosyltransferase